MTENLSDRSDQRSGGYRTSKLPTRGGEITVGEWGPSDGPAVLAVHGVTSNHLVWQPIAGLLPNVHLIAPDLRGRGRSNTLPGPWGMVTHADDLASVLDCLGVQSALVVGHSMGAFVSLVFANRHPKRVDSLVLVDGGLPLISPPGLSDEEATRAILGPAAERLSMTFQSRESYRDYWRAHPAFANDWTPFIQSHLDYDLDGEAPNLKPSTSFEAVAADSIELRGGDSLMQALDGLAHPAAFLWAPRGLLNEIPPLYPMATIDRWSRRLPALAVREVKDVNHYTIVLADAGARTVAETIRLQLGTSGAGSVSADEHGASRSAEEVGQA